MRHTLLLALLLPARALAVDLTAPTDGTVLIAAGAAYTNVASVTVEVSATDDVGVTEMCLSTLSSCTAWQSFSSPVAMSLGTTQGTRTVYAKFRDAAGNVSATVTDTILLDTVAPTGGSASVSIAGSGELDVSWSGFTELTSGLNAYLIAYRTGSAPATRCTTGTVVTESGSATRLTGLSDGTTYYIRVCPIDAAGNVGSGVTASGMPKAEVNPPSGSVTINSGAVYATSTAVSLSLSATDDTSVTQMCISNTTSCTSWQTYTTTKTWSLSGQGTRTVYVWFKDGSGNISAVATDDVFVDSVKPTNGLVTATPLDAGMELAWSGFADSGSGIASYKVLRSTSSVTSCSVGTLIYTGNATSYTDSGLTNGTKYYYRVCATDDAGNTSSGSTTVGTAASELDPPTDGAVSINSGAAWTNSSSVSLSLSATDASGVAKMCISNTTSCTTYQTYTSPKTWSLSGSSTTRTVYAWFQDSNGNQTTAPVSDTINIDLVKPGNGTVFTVAGTVSVDLSWTGYTDTTSGIASYKVVYAASTTAPSSCNVGTTGYVGTGTSATISGLATGTTYTFRVCAIDNAGNLSTGSTGSARTVVDSTPPTGTITINSGADWTNNPLVTLDLAATDASGVAAQCIADSPSYAACVSATYAAAGTWTFSGGDGPRSLFVWYTDSAGNVMSTPASDTITLDQTAPLDGTVSAGAGSPLPLSWSGYTDATAGIASYLVSYNLDGSDPGACTGDVTTSVTGTSTDIDGLAALSYTFRVCAVDNAGNLSAGASVTSCVAQSWYPDQDGDGYGDEAEVLLSCADPSSLSDLDGSADTVLYGASVDVQFAAGAAGVGDINNDGYDDMVVGAWAYGASYTGRAYVYHGGADGLPTTAALTIDGPSTNALFASSVAGAGDVNADGYDDVIIGAEGYSLDDGLALVYHGGPSGLSTTASQTLRSDTVGGSLGWPVSAAGDVNGDGYGDVLVGAYEDSTGSVRLFLGGPAGVEPLPATTLHGEDYFDYFSTSIGSAGDVNGDGYDDVIVGADGYGSTQVGRAYVYHGSARGLVEAAAQTYTGRAADDYLGTAAQGAGDLNGDGYDDVVITAAQAGAGGEAYIYYGSAAGVGSTGTTLDGEVGSYLGVSAAAAGDVNLDGYDDVLIGATDGFAARIYLGSSTGVDPSTWVELEGDGGSENFGGLLGAAGDVNGDHHPDLFISANTYLGNTGKLYFYLGATGAAYVEEGGDCDDTAPAIHPSADEVCDGVDNDCDGLSDGDDPGVDAWTWYFDADHDTYGGSTSTTSCDDPTSVTAMDTTEDTTLEGPTTGSSFGESVASGDVNGDGWEDVIVGAPTVSSDAGQAWVYHGSATGLETTAALTLTGAASSELGTAVAAVDVNHDGYDDVLIGAGAASGTGAVYVYLGSSSGVDSTPAQTFVGEAAADRYGDALSAAGDVNADGYDDVVVGAYNYGSTAGRAYLYHGGATGLTLGRALSDPSGNSGFGMEVAGIGDVNFDGYDDVGIASLTNITLYGEVAIFHGSASGLGTSATLTLTGAAMDSFGGSFVGAGDTNGDGFADLLVGASRHDTNAGRVYLYHGSTAGLSSIAAQTFTGTAGMYLGDEVMGAGDLNRDGYDDVVVRSQPSTEDQVTLYHGSAAGLTEALTFSDHAIVGFGSAMSSGDVNGDGGPDLLIGNPGTMTYTGRLSVYHSGSAVAWFRGPFVDCDDADPTIHPDALERCDGLDNDCDGLLDDADRAVVGQTTWYADNDGDSFGDVANAMGFCVVPAGYVADTTDCNDDTATVYPGATEICDDLDNDCDTLVDGDDPSILMTVWYRDEDGDGYGGTDTTITGCEDPNVRLDDLADATLTGAGTGYDFGQAVTAGDVNNDGFADVVVGAPSYSSNRGRTYVYLGSEAGLATTAARTLTGVSTNHYFGSEARVVGDVNNDGYDDLVVGAYGYSSFTGRAYVYHGTTSGVSSSSARTLTGPAAGAWFGRAITGGDVNGDGYDDVIIGAGKHSAGGIFAYLGSSSGVSSTSTSVLAGSTLQEFGRALATADVNHDGYDDVIVGASDYSFSGSAHVFHGSATGMQTTASQVISGETGGDFFGAALASAGDVNGDGYDDVVVAAPFYETVDLNDAGRIYLFHGSAAGLSSSPARTVTGSVEIGAFGSAVYGAGDVNNDGYDDVLVGAPEEDSLTGTAYLFHGSATGLVTTPVLSIAGENSVDLFGAAVTGAGDINGDTYADLLIGAHGYSSSTGRAYVYWGGTDASYIADAVDCDDADVTIHPGADEVCDDLDNDCDTLVDDADTDALGTVWYADADGDNYGDPTQTLSFCDLPDGYLADDTDCDDDDADIHPSASEVCDSADNDCDGLVDSADPGVSGEALWYWDLDADGFGGSPALLACEQPTNYVNNNLDCDNTNAAIGEPYTWMLDEDGDGYGNIAALEFACTEPGLTDMDALVDTTLTGESAGDIFASAASHVGDVNGDGYDDVVVGAYAYDSAIGRAYVYHGGADGLLTFAARILDGEAGSSLFGFAVAGAGDLNNDGYGDVLVGAPGYSTSTGRAYVYHGSSGGLLTTATAAINGEAIGDWYGRALSGAGDTNNDGYDDIIVGAYAHSTSTGRAYVYHGSAGGVVATVARILNGAAINNAFGYAVSGAGDVNNDGFSDVIVGAYTALGNTGRAYIYHGAGSGLTTVAARTLTGEAVGNNFGIAVAGGGDLNADSFDDVLIGANGYGGGVGRAYVYTGGGSGIGASITDMTTGASAGGSLGLAVGVVGDVNTDGFADVVIGAPGYSSDTGRALLFHGDASGLSATAMFTFTGEGAANFFGAVVGGAGDVNGDGSDDLLVGAYGYSSNTGRLYGWLGDTWVDYVRADLAGIDSDDLDPLVH